MRPQKVDDQQLMTGLMEVIRSKGFEGASMQDLAEATGLKKASLYHRFPGGKQEITEAVLSFTQRWGAEHILGVLTDSTKAPKERLSKALQNVRSLYREGEAICVLRALTVDPSLPLFAKQIESSFESWIKGFTILATDMGIEEAKARSMAIQAVYTIQGSLVVSKGLNDLSIFRQALDSIETTYSI